MGQTTVALGAGVTIAAANPIGFNFAMNGWPQLVWKGFPIFQDFIRSSTGFLNPAGGNQTLDAATGWPIGDFQVNLAQMNDQKPWMKIGGSLKFACGFTGVGTPSAYNNAVVSNIVTTGSGATMQTTFDVQATGSVFGFKVLSTTPGAIVPYVFAYDPDYRASQSNAGNINGWSPVSLFRADAIAIDKQAAHLRLMWYSGTWYSKFQQDLTTRRTPANTKAVYPTGRNTEVFPIAWMLDYAAALRAAGGKTGVWICTPPLEDATNTWTSNTLADAAYILPTGTRVYIEPCNEVWNGSGPAGGSTGTFQTAAAAAGYTGSNYIQWYAQRLKALAAVARTAFGSTRFGTDVRLVAANQQGANGQSLLSTMCSYMLAQGMGIGIGVSDAAKDVHYLSNAPYMNMKAPVATWTIAQIVSNLLGTDGSANPVAANNVAFNSLCESLTIRAQQYGLKTIAYEGCSWQTNGEPSTITNIGAAIEDTTMQSVVEAGIAAVFDAGYEGQTIMENGVSGQSVSNPLGASDEITTDYASLIAQTSPRWKGYKTYMPGTYVPQRNVIASHGASFDARNSQDNTFGAAYPTFDQWSEYVVKYLFYVPTAGTFPLLVEFTTGVASRLTNVVVDWVTLYSGIVIPANLTQVQRNLGNVTLSKGFHSLVLGNGSNQSAVSVSKLITFN